MKFLRKNKFEKTILVISDIHLGAGTIVGDQRNFLEDFHFDKEMVEFCEYFSSGEYEHREVELVINGDLFDLLAVPFIEFFDDEFWSEEAAIEKLKVIFKAHPEVLDAFSEFCEKPNKKIVFIVGNHDAEFVFESLQQMFLDRFSDKARPNVRIILNNQDAYIPYEGIHIKHGHEYEVAHDFDPENSILEDEDGRKYFTPPWGSYYVTRVVNKYKEEREHVNMVKPIPKFMINGFIYDTLFTIRFGLANAYYFLMVRIIDYLMTSGKNIFTALKDMVKDLELWEDLEVLTADYFEHNKDAKVLIVGHTHEPALRSYVNGTTFINTGTWMKIYRLDFHKLGFSASPMTFAQIDIPKTENGSVNFIQDVAVGLNSWKGVKNTPFTEY